jgi:hypothetical protein
VLGRRRRVAEHVWAHLVAAAEGGADPEERLRQMGDRVPPEYWPSGAAPTS